MARIKVNHEEDAERPDEARPEQVEETQETPAPKEEACADAEQISSLRDEVKRLEDALKHERADFINYKQRISAELGRASLAVKRQLVAEVADLVDAFHHTDQGLDNHHQDFDGLKDAYAILRGHLDNLMAKWQLEITGVPGEPFDPARHEAMIRIEDPSVDGPTVREVIKPGVAMPDMVIRSAQVVVASPPAEQKAEDADAEEDGAPENDGGGEE